MRIGMMTDMDKPYISRITNPISCTKEYLMKAGQADFEQRMGGSAGQLLTGTSHAPGFLCRRCVKTLMLILQLVYAHTSNLTGRLENLRP